MATPTSDWCAADDADRILIVGDTGADTAEDDEHHEVVPVRDGDNVEVLFLAERARVRIMSSSSIEKWPQNSSRREYKTKIRKGTLNRAFTFLSVFLLLTEMIFEKSLNKYMKPFKYIKKSQTRTCTRPRSNAIEKGGIEELS